MNLRPAHSLMCKGLKNEALDVLFTLVDEALCRGGFEEVDAAILDLSTLPLDTTLWVGVLSITRPAAPVLPSREVFLQQLREHLRDDPSRLERLTGGLAQPPERRTDDSD